MYSCDYLEIKAEYAVNESGMRSLFPTDYNVITNNSDYCYSDYQISLEAEREYTLDVINEISQLDLPERVMNQALFLLNSVHTERMIHFSNYYKDMRY